MRPRIHDTEDDYPPRGWWEAEGGSKPLPVGDGIAASTRRGPIGATWWSRRFLSTIEASMGDGRMRRGRTYARKGQIIDLEVHPGVVKALVQGSREEPYRVRLALPPVPTQDWERILADLASEAGYAARMLAGDLPAEVEDVFAAQGASLFPSPHARLTTECTCPDWDDPCKHVAAVCYLLAESFDRDPFELFAWRGRSRASVLSGLYPARTAARPDEGSTSRAGLAGRDVTGGHGLGEGAPGSFWHAGPELARCVVRHAVATHPAALLGSLPAGLIDIGGEDLADALAPVYERIVACAARRALE